MPNQEPIDREQRDAADFKNGWLDHALNRATIFCLAVVEERLTLARRSLAQHPIAGLFQFADDSPQTDAETENPMAEGVSFSARCPYCGTSVDCNSSAADEPRRNPAHGDLAVCFSCATLLEFAENSYVLAPASRLAEIPHELLAPIESTLHRQVRTVPA